MYKLMQVLDNMMYGLFSVWWSEYSYAKIILMTISLLMSTLYVVAMANITDDGDDRAVSRTAVLFHWLHFIAWDHPCLYIAIDKASLHINQNIWNAI